KLVLLMGADDVIRGKRHRHLVWVPGGLLVDAVNQVHGAPRVAALEVRLYPDGEKLSTQVAFLDLAEIEVAVRNGSVLAEIEVLIEEALRRIGMRIDDQSRLVDSLGRINLFGSLCGLGCSVLDRVLLGQRKCGKQDEANCRL